MKSKIIILLLIFPLNFLFTQDSTGSDVINPIASLQNIMNEVNVEKIENSGKIDGSYYFFKVPNDANIKLVDSNRPLRINLNYNISY